MSGILGQSSGSLQGLEELWCGGRGSCKAHLCLQSGQHRTVGRLCLLTGLPEHHSPPGGQPAASCRASLRRTAGILQQGLAGWHRDSLLASVHTCQHMLCNTSCYYNEASLVLTVWGSQRWTRPDSLSASARLSTPDMHRQSAPACSRLSPLDSKAPAGSRSAWWVHGGSCPPVINLLMAYRQSTLALPAVLALCPRCSSWRTRTPTFPAPFVSRHQKQRRPCLFLPRLRIATGQHRI